MTMLAPSSDLLRHAGKFYGKYSGEVVEVDDPDQLGRIKVSVPSIFPPETAIWARPCFPSGHFFVPPIAAKVWVEFEAGDVNYPLWVGTWYPQGTVPAEADLPSPTGRVVHTPSGHVIELSDADGEEKVIIRHKLDSFVSIDKEGSILAENQNGSYLLLNAPDAEVSLTGEQGHMLTIGDDGVVVLHTGGAQVEVADGKVTITGPSAVEVVAQEVTLEADAINLGGSAQEPAVLGNKLKDAFNNHTHPTAMGPTGTPIPPLLPVALSNSVKVQS